jgi:predicted ribosomally synthesized peptide with nif11-like leader
MAKENVKKFFEEVSKNEDLQKQLKAATEKSSAEIAKDVKAQAEAVVEVAKKAGFDFSADDLLSAGASEDSKLDMNELDAVAGGWCFFIGTSQDGMRCAIISEGRHGLCFFLGFDGKDDI